MALVLVGRERWPIIKEKNISVKNVEKIFVGKPFGMAIVLNSEKQPIGCFQLGKWTMDGNIFEMQNVTVWKERSEITADQLRNHTLFPIVNEEGKMIQLYYETESSDDASSDQLIRLMEIQQMGYDFKHAFDKLGCNGKRVAIVTDNRRLKSSLEFAEIMCNQGTDVDFVGLFMPKAYKDIVDQNIFNFNCGLNFIEELSEIVDKGVDIIYFNMETYLRASRISYFKNNGVSCRDVWYAIRIIYNAGLTDYTVIKYKKYFADKGIDLLTMAVPRAEDLGERKGSFTKETLMQFMLGYMDKESAEDIYITLREFLKNVVKEGDLRYYKDINSRMFNVVSKCRFTANQPVDYTKTVYLVGPCIVASLYVKDEETLGSHLQAYYNVAGECVRVVALPISTEIHREYYFKTVESLQPEKGDTILFIDQKFRFLRYDMDCIEECRQAVEKHGRQIYCDSPSHCNSTLMKIIAKKIFDGLHRDYDTVQYNKDYEKYYADDKAHKQMQTVERLTHNKELLEYKEFLRENSLAKRVINGAIVMNCNPFTLGHRYLIEYAASQVDYLYIFAVQEDKSFFKFEDRIALIKKGTAHLPNVRVLPSGKFIISSATFSEYFDKVNLRGTTVDTSMDVEIFGKHIAPTLDITVRFVGQEPLDPITNQYNQSLIRILPKYGIELREIPRKESDGKVISASRVRKCLEEGRWEEIKEIVPETTYDFLYEKFYNKK